MSCHVEADGWHLTAALPEGFEQVRQHLIAEVVYAAEGCSVAPMRCSRRAVTYNCQVTAPTGTRPVFIKVIAPVRGIDRLKRKLRRAGVAHVVRITAEIIAAGFRAPPIWIWGSHPATGRELLVTPRAPGYGPLRTVSILAGDAPAKWRLLAALGDEIARFHRAGFAHGDLTPFNLFTSSDTPAFVLLDHERTRLRRRWGTRRQARNLVQLGRFAIPTISRTDRMRVLRAYARARPLEAAAARRIAKMLARRLHRQGGLEPVELPAHFAWSRRAAC